MHPIIKIVSFILHAGVLLSISCKKETSCEGCDTKNNKPPIAVAGPDQVITLPTDSISLDGSLSSDPDGKISEWLWTKISGPASLNIVKPTDSITKVKNLVAGTYLFELKVTDNGGLSAKDTIQITVDLVFTTNHPPIANAGADQNITLPTNTVNLDGSASTDPDNNITNYLWTKIVGPSSFSITNANGAQIQVANLVQGIYQFELKVTDAGGLFSKDTVRISVSVSGGPLSVYGCNSMLVPFSHLSRPSSVMRAITAGNKIFFTTHANGIWITEIYDTISNTWSTSNERFGQISINDKLIDVYYQYPVNTEIFEVYNTVTNSRTTHTVPEARAFINHIVTDNKVIFSGGSNPDSAYTSVSKRVDIYDNTTSSWSMINFDGARYGMSMVGFGNKIFFAGGTVIRYDSLILSCDDAGNNCTYYPATVGSKRIDIYNLSSNTWSRMELITPRINPTTAIVGNKILFAGGGINSIDIYDVSNNTWSVISVSPESIRARVHTVGNKVLFPALQSVGIYDAATNSWSSVQMSEPNIQSHYRVAIAGSKILFFLVFDWENNSRNIDIYDASANTWCHAVLNQGTLGTGIITVGNRIYVAGGFIRSNSNGVYDTNIDDVWIFNF